LFRIHLLVSKQRLRVDAAQLSFDEREQRLTDDVRQTYYEVLQSQSQHESQESMVKYLEELQQLTERRFAQREALEADKLSVKAELAKAVYQLTTIEDALADRKEVLNHLLGRNLQIDFSVESVPTTLPEEQDLATARAIALEHRPEIQQATNRMSQAELETKIETTRYIPDVSIQASYYFHHFAVGSSLLLDFCTRSQVDQMGGDRKPAEDRYSRTNHVTNARTRSQISGRMVWI
jgi:outer membrane protein TolC